jgi:hypothetical protein
MEKKMLAKNLQLIKLATMALTAITLFSPAPLARVLAIV